MAEGLAGVEVAEAVERHRQAVALGQMAQALEVAFQGALRCGIDDVPAAAADGGDGAEAHQHAVPLRHQLGKEASNHRDHGEEVHLHQSLVRAGVETALVSRVGRPHREEEATDLLLRQELVEPAGQDFRFRGVLGKSADARSVRGRQVGGQRRQVALVTRHQHQRTAVPRQPLGQGPPEPRGRSHHHPGHNPRRSDTSER